MATQALIVRGGVCLTPQGIRTADVGVRDGEVRGAPGGRSVGFPYRIFNSAGSIIQARVAPGLFSPSSSMRSAPSSLNPARASNSRRS